MALFPFPIKKRCDLGYSLHCRDKVCICNLSAKAFSPRSFQIATYVLWFCNSPDGHELVAEPSWSRSLAASSPFLLHVACIKIKIPTCIETRHPPAAATPKHFNLSWSDHASPFCPVNLVLFGLMLVSHRPSSCSVSPRTCVHVHVSLRQVDRNSTSPLVSE